jgi:hypothetical protein
MKKLRPPLVKGVADLQSQAEPTTASTTGETNQDIDTQTRQALEELQASLQSEHQVEAGEPEPQPEPLPNFGGVSQRTFDAQKARGARTTGRSGYETVQPGTDSQLAVRIAAAREARLEPLTRGKGYKTVTHQTKNPKSLFTSLAGAAKKIGQRT